MALDVKTPKGYRKAWNGGITPKPAEDATTPPTRYRIWVKRLGASFEQCADPDVKGEWVKAADYEALAAERDQLHAEKENLYTLAQNLQKQLLEWQALAVKYREALNQTALEVVELLKKE